MKILKAIDRVYTFILKIISALLALVMFALVCTTTWQVLSRYLSGSPQMWPTDLAAYGLVFLTFMGMGILLREDGHIRIDLVYLKLPRLAQKILNTVMDLIGVITLITVACFAFRLDISYFEKNTFLIGSVFNIPKYMIFSFVPLGLAITAIEFIRRLVKDIVLFFRDDESGEGKGSGE